MIGNFRFRYRFRPKFRSKIEPKTEICVDLSGHEKIEKKTSKFFFPTSSYYLYEILGGGTRALQVSAPATPPAPPPPTYKFKRFGVSAFPDKKFPVEAVPSLATRQLLYRFSS